MRKNRLAARIDKIRLATNSLLDQRSKRHNGQFMTPAHVSCFMTSLFSNETTAVKLLDAGSGVGSLTAAFLDKFDTEERKIEADLYEIDKTVFPQLEKSVKLFEQETRCEFYAATFNEDYLETACDLVYSTSNKNKKERYTHVILNPPL